MKERGRLRERGGFLRPCWDPKSRFGESESERDRDREERGNEKNQYR